MMVTETVSETFYFICDLKQMVGNEHFIIFRESFKSYMRYLYLFP
jgi:hypothetical protein